MNLAYKQAETSVKGVADSLRKLSSEEKLELLVKQQSVNGSKGLTQAQTEQVLATQGVNVATKRSVAEKISAIATTRQTIQSLQEEIAAHRSNTIILTSEAEAERQASITKKEAQLVSEKSKLGSLEKSLGGSIPQKAGMSAGMMWGVAAVTTAVSAINNFSQAKQSKNAGEALGNSIGGGVTTALSGAMIGFQAGGGFGALIGGIGGLLVSGISSLIGYSSGETQRSIAKANELMQEYNQAAETIKSNLSTLESLKDEFNRLSKGVDDYGETIISAPVVWKHATRTVLNPLTPKAV